MFSRQYLGVSLGLALALLGGPMPAAHAQDGVTAKKVVLGQSAAFTGPASELGTEMRAGALAYFEHINRQGGVHGRRIELTALDDGYEPDRAAANTRKLIADGAFLLFGYVGTPTSNASKPIFTEAQVPFVGPFTGAESLRAPVNRFIFNVRASYFAETDKIIEQMVNLGLTKIAVFYQNDDYGRAGLAGVERAVKKRNLGISVTGTVERNTIDVAAAVKAIAATEPQAVVMISAYKSCAAFIREMKKAGSNPQFINVSFVGSRALANELGETGRGVGITQVVPFPWNLGVPVVREYQRLFAAASGKSEFSFTSLEGFIAAKVLVEGLRRTGPNLTRERFIATMENFGFDTGGFTVSYTPDDHSGSRFVELTVITKEGKFLR
ncbi:MAG: ABC transporter substrate-binding protein [Burkholderiales bacterium]|nr:ABC transporter substrate-binding protein [Burkholderiales bacterium]